MQFRGAQRSLAVGLQIEAASHRQARHLDFFDGFQRNRRAREVKGHFSCAGVIVEIACHESRRRSRRVRRQAHLGVGDSHFAGTNGQLSARTLEAPRLHRRVRTHQTGPENSGCARVPFP